MSDQPTIEQLLESEAALWAEVQARLAHLPAHEALAELNSLLDNVRRAGGGTAMFIVFAQSWLSTVRA